MVFTGSPAGGRPCAGRDGGWGFGWCARCRGRSARAGAAAGPAPAVLLAGSGRGRVVGPTGRWCRPWQRTARAAAAGRVRPVGGPAPWLTTTVTCCLLTRCWSCIHTRACAASVRLYSSGRTTNTTENPAGTPRVHRVLLGSPHRVSMITGAKQSCTMLTAVRSCRLENRSLSAVGPQDGDPRRCGPYLQWRPNAQQTRQIVDPMLAGHLGGLIWVVVGRPAARGVDEQGGWPDVGERQAGQGGRQQGGDGGPAGAAGQGADQHPMAPRPVLQREPVVGVAVPRRPRRRHHHPTGVRLGGCLDEWPSAGQLDRDRTGAVPDCRPCRAVLHHHLRSCRSCSQFD